MNNSSNKKHRRQRQERLCISHVTAAKFVAGFTATAVTKFGSEASGLRCRKRMSRGY